METLKQMAITVFSLFILVSGMAQHESKWQKAFEESYTQELNKQYAAAIQSLKSVYEESSYELNLRLGWLTYLNKEYPTSREYYQKAINLKPYGIEAKLGITYPLAALQLTDKTLEVYTDILKIDPQNTKANYWSGVIWYNRKKYEQAAKFLEKVVNLYPFDFDGNHMLAWTYLHLGRNTEASILFGKALLAKPNDPSCLEGLKEIK